MKAVAAGAKKRAEEGGDATAPTAAAAPASPVVASVLGISNDSPRLRRNLRCVSCRWIGSATVDPSAAEHKPTGQADRTLMLRSTYCGVVDTGPVPGETFEQKESVCERWPLRRSNARMAAETYRLWLSTDYAG